MDRIHIPSNLPVTADMVRRLEEEVASLRARLQAVEGERRRDAVDGQAALDEANNRVVQAEQRVAGLEAALREMREATMPAAVWKINGVARLRHAIDGDELPKAVLEHIVMDVLNTLASSR